MADELINVNDTNIATVVTTELVKNNAVGEKLAFHAQAAITFELVNTNLVALYKKDGENNTFLVIPTDKEPSGGMTIADMVKDINTFLQRFDSSATPINADDVTNAVKDVNDASNNGSQENPPVYESINVELRQAFLYLSTGKPVEYGFELDVDISGLFPPDISLFKVNKLSIGVWNTDREKILERMNIIEVDTYLK